MIGKIAKVFFGSANDRFIKKQYKTINKINALEPQTVKLGDEELKAKTAEFRERLKQGETLDDLLPEAFAVVREAARRTLGQRHYDVQLIGGIVLHKGMIAEMKTGEGKTLVATPLILTPWKAKACISLPSTTIWLNATPSGWGRYIVFWG
mgnify:CR=1 FL=1